MLPFLSVSMYYIQTFRRHTEYIPNVWTPTLKIYCTVVLLRSHITAVSPTVEHQPVAVTSFTNFNALSSVRGGLKIFHYFFRNSTVTKTCTPLIMKGPWNTKRQDDEFIIFGPYWNSPDLDGKFYENILLRPKPRRQEFFRLFIQCISQQNTITLILESRQRSNFPQVTFDFHLTSIFNFTTFSLSEMILLK